MSFNAKNGLTIKKVKMSVRYNKTVVDFIFAVHYVLKVPRVCCKPLTSMCLELTIALGTFKTSSNP